MRNCQQLLTLLVLIPGPSALYVSLLRVPLEEPTVAKQVLKTGTGGLNIDACRVNIPNGDWKGKGGGGVHERWNGEPIKNIVYGKGYRRNRPIYTTGRWPSNLLLVHHEECIEEGTKRIKGIVAGNTTAISQSGAHAKAKGHQTIGRKQQVTHYADSDGLETVSNWICHPSCPVRLLDEQSGNLKSGTGAVKRSTAKGYQPSAFGKESRSVGSPNVEYGDSGGASRFFPQFKNLAECLDWVTKLIGKF